MAEEEDAARESDEPESPTPEAAPEIDLGRSQSAPGPIPELRRLDCSSTFRREPAWQMASRGGEEVFEFHLPSSTPDAASLFCRARLLSTRPVPDTAAEPDKFMTHKLEFIIGGTGQEWARVDETRHKLSLTATIANKRVPFEGVPYNVLVPSNNAEPSPVHYGYLTMEMKYPRSRSIVLGHKSFPPAPDRDSPARKEAEQKRNERRDRARKALMARRTSEGPDPTKYNPPTSTRVIPVARMPVYGFGSAPRLPKPRIVETPDPGTYLPKNCWDGRRTAMHGGRQGSRRGYAAGLEPTRYDTLRGLDVTREKDPIWRLNTTGSRTKLIETQKPPPGAYDAKYSCVDRRDPVFQYKKRSSFPIGASPQTPDPHFFRFTVM